MNKLKSPVSLSQKNNQMDHSDSHLVTTLRLVYRLSALVEEENSKTEDVNTVRLLSTVYKTALVLKELNGNPEEITSVVASVHKMTVVLKELKRDSTEIIAIVASIYRMALLFKELKRDPTEITSITASLYKMAFLFKEHSKEPDEITSCLILYIEGIMRVFRSEYFPSNDKTIVKNLEDAFSEGQLKSKLWLIQKLKDHNLSPLDCVFSCAGWYGVLPFLLMTDNYFSIQKCFLFERDPLSVRVSEDLNRHFVKKNWKFKASLQNILDLDYSNACFNTLKANETAQEIYAVPDTIINTACEHIENFELWWSKIPPQKLIILQNNDYFDLPDHINCISSLKEFKKQAEMDFLYEGALDLGAYRRFMLIGHKKS